MDPIKILIIDDDADFCYTVKTYFEKAGDYKVSVETNGWNGISAAEKMRPDIILLDLCMPSIDGLQALKELKKNRRTVSIPVVMLTGMDDSDAKIKAVHNYCEYYILKPGPLDIVKSKVDYIVRLRKPSASAGAVVEGKVRAGQGQDRKPEKGPPPDLGKKIRVVDDEKTVCDYIEPFLKSLGYSITSCWEPPKALALYTSEKPDITILDIVMPGVDGVDILAAIKEMDKRAIVIIITAVRDGGLIKDLITLGADDVIIKPFSLDQIHATILKHLAIAKEK